MAFFRTDGGGWREGRIIGTLLLVFLVVATLATAVYRVDVGERAVTYNTLTKTLSCDDGIGVRIPLVTRLEKYQVRERLHSAEAWGASHDLQDVHTTVAVRFAPATPCGVTKIHSTYGQGYDAILVAPAVQETVKAVTAQYQAEELITQRPAAKAAITDALRERLAEVGLATLQVDVTDFDFSPAFNAAIEAKVVAEQDRTRAETEAQTRNIEAGGQANATLTIARAQAEAAREECAPFPDYDVCVRYIYAKRFDGRLPLSLGGDGLSLLLPPSVVP